MFAVKFSLRFVNLVADLGGKKLAKMLSLLFSGSTNTKKL